MSKAKLLPPKNTNYAAVIVRVEKTNVLPGMDNLVGLTLFGTVALVSKDIQPGDVGVYFPAESQLSDAYCRKNNLYSDKSLNKDQKISGYIGTNRRIRAVKFRGNVSSCLFMPLGSLSEFVDTEKLEVGDTFDELNGEEICRKYQLPVKGPSRMPKQETKARILSKFLPEHYDTDNWFRNKHRVDPEEEVIVTQKVHGTSWRCSNMPVDRVPSLVERLAMLLGIKVDLKDYKDVAGSRKVIKGFKDGNNFYGNDIHSAYLSKVEGCLPKGYAIYGELIGWTESGAKIQAGYTYDLPALKSRLLAYRVSIINPDGIIHDLTHDQMVRFCAERGIDTVRELWRGKAKELEAEEYLDKKYYTEHPNCVPLSDDGTVDEGIVIRTEGSVPMFYKAKSPMFLKHETDLLDTGEADIESQESIITE